MSITRQISNTLANLNGVAFSDTRHGWAVGAIEKDNGPRVGIIVATSDGGATWAVVHQTTMTLRDIAFPDTQHGWAVGGNPPTILATADGGGTWKPQTSGIEDHPRSHFTAVAFPDTRHGWVVGAVSNGGVILATADGGATWSRQAQDAVNFANDFRGVAFPDTQHGWAVGSASPEGGGLIVATSNGGKTWERQTTPVTNDDTGVTDLLWGIAFADINHGLAVGDNGTILATADGGRTWTSKPSGTDARLFRVAFPDINHGWAVGQTTTGGGVILMTADGGGTWTPQIPEADPGQALLGVAFPDISHGWLVGGSGTILTVLDVMPRIFQSLIQSNFIRDGHGNLEAVIIEGDSLMHWWRDSGIEGRPWQRGQRVTEDKDEVAGPAALIESDFIHDGHGNFEVVVPLKVPGGRVELWHFFHNNSDVNLLWERVQRVTGDNDEVAGPAALIQSDFIRDGHGNFEVVVPPQGAGWPGRVVALFPRQRRGQPALGTRPARHWGQRRGGRTGCPHPVRLYP